MVSGESRVIYTAVFGGYDTLNPVTNGYGHSHICFTDRAQKAAGWVFIEDVWRANTPRRAARMRKVLSHQFLPDAKYSIWVDGNIELPTSISPDTLISAYLKDADMAAFAHPNRDCTYQEAVACARLHKDDPSVLERQVLKYRRKGFPSGSGLVATGILIRRHTEQVREFNEAWWAEICRYSVRDQVSFMYAAWKTNTRCRIIPGRIGARHHG